MSFAAFNQQIEREFVEGSAIHPSLYQACIHIVRDIELASGVRGQHSDS